MTEDEIMQRAHKACEESASRRLDAPDKPAASDVARLLGYDVDRYASIEWRGDDIVMVERGFARDVQFTLTVSKPEEP